MIKNGNSYAGNGEVVQKGVTWDVPEGTTLVMENGRVVKDTLRGIGASSDAGQSA